MISQVSVTTQQGFIPVDDRMRVIDSSGNLVSMYFPNVFRYHFSSGKHSFTAALIERRKHTLSSFYVRYQIESIFSTGSKPFLHRRCQRKDDACTCCKCAGDIRFLLVKKTWSFNVLLNKRLYQNIFLELWVFCSY